MHRRGAKQIDVIFVLEPRLANAMLLRMVERAHRDAERCERLEPDPGIGRRAHMAELARGAAAARHDAAMAADPLLLMRLLGYCVIDQPLIGNLRDKSDYHVCRVTADALITAECCRGKSGTNKGQTP